MFVCVFVRERWRKRVCQDDYDTTILRLSEALTSSYLLSVTVNVLNIIISNFWQI